MRQLCLMTSAMICFHPPPAVKNWCAGSPGGGGGGKFDNNLSTIQKLFQLAEILVGEKDFNQD